MPHLLPSLVRFACSTFAIVGLSASSLAREAVDWEIGPVIRSKNYSVGMPLHPVRLDKGWYFDFPYPDVRSGHVHYVTFDPGSLAGKTRIIIRYKIKADQNVRFVSREYPDKIATVSLFFQRSGDTWTATVLYYLLILPVYNGLLLAYGFLFGQFQFFWEFEKRFMSRIFARFKKP